MKQCKGSNIIDIEDINSWPTDVTEALNNNQDLSQCLLGKKVHIYHATKLLPYEVTSINTNGLQGLTRKSMINKINEAVENCYIDESSADKLLRGYYFNGGYEKDLLESDYPDERTDFLSLVLTKNALSCEHDLHKMLYDWGGEVLKLELEVNPDRATESRLESMGQPSIVVAHLTLEESILKSNYTIESTFCDIFTTSKELGHNEISIERINSDDICRVLNPWDSEWDTIRHPLCL